MSLDHEDLLGNVLSFFLSHSSADKPAVEELARRLAKEGNQAWLDKWNLIPGDRWQSAIEKALAESETCAVFVGPSGAGLIATLKHDAIQDSCRWPVAISRPGPDPVESLAVALSIAVNVGQGASALADLITELQRNEKALHLTTRQSLSENTSDNRFSYFSCSTYP
jgi:hypothetical protein